MAETKGNSQRSRRSSTRSSSRRAEKITINSGPDPSEPSLEADLSALADGAHEMQQPICSVALCPICLVVTAVGEARPDLVQHLLGASREVLLAVRSLIDARLEGTAKPSKLERIKVE
ncbi:MAG TPA: hypothetical protein VHI54_03850 [Actinomycetota bacterium]|nr:hypothetical protein [Actinomycetota bacterium]